mmetsp:Transcript_38062/g.123789  ORF Transcript_38062/g.123789 Transcript_38062/m.123789 type:complete len:215 (-) Transcript_38062:426-1070(-)
MRPGTVGARGGDAHAAHGRAGRGVHGVLALLRAPSARHLARQRRRRRRDGGAHGGAHGGGGGLDRAPSRTPRDEWPAAQHPQRGQGAGRRKRDLDPPCPGRGRWRDRRGRRRRPGARRGAREGPGGAGMSEVQRRTRPARGAVGRLALVRRLGRQEADRPVNRVGGGRGEGRVRRRLWHVREPAQHLLDAVLASWWATPFGSMICGPPSWSCDV